ncbi:hypothetical protein KVH27_19640 [Streptomyces olivaceus]|uniref:hypothetical protein n=1 Tax=Streptomyces olivaceus TaxID=47716 RepID=UPI001CCF2C0B|nr:hypothetical protein [Streptomyces olivaceus]MBZ6250582.1 hypothetical protein [Streptomyces olivaceus]
MRAATVAFSHRRAFLVAVGTGWALYGGLGIIGNTRYGTARGLADITRHVPGGLDTLGWMWVVCGAVAALAGLVVNCPRIQSAGYVALGVPAGLWSGAFAAAAASTYPQAVGSACGWGAFTIGVVLVSGMDDPPPPHLRKAGR